MSRQDLTKIKGQTPISIIVHGGNLISFLLAKTLLEQGSHVVIIDKYTNTSKQYFAQLKKTGKVSFIDFKGLKNFYEKIARIDYLYYMLGEKVESDSKNIDSRDFLSETDYLNDSLNSANKFKAKISLITSLRLNRELANRINNDTSGKPKPYSPLELQRYGENYAAEFVDKTKANLRIIRLATVVGKSVNEIRDTVLNNLFLDATQKHQIEIDGEGLEIHNLVNESDAIYGILKLTFSDYTQGEVISLCNKNDYTTLSLAYKLLELDVESKAIKFMEKDDTGSILQDLYVPAPNASQYGWKQNISLEESVVEQVKAYYEKSDRKWEIDRSGDLKKYKADEVSNITKTKLGVLVYSLLSPFKKFSNPKELFHTINYFKIFKNISLLVALFLLIYYLMSPLVGISLGGVLVYNQSKSLREDITQLDFDSIESSTKGISENISRIEENLSRIYWIFRITNSTEQYKNINQIIQGTEHVAESTQDLVIGLRPLGEYIKDFEPAINLENTNTEDIKEYDQYLQSMDDNRYLLSEGIYQMSLAENIISSVNTNKLPKVMQDFVSEYKALITDINNIVKPMEDVSQFLPDILGLNERKRYLIFLQENGEIRSTGGWISSYAIIAIENGQIREFFVDDIFNAQATLNLQGYTYRTPNSMVRALENTKYTFPLVNWDPSLDNVMQSSEEFIFDLGKGNQLDGVITIDTIFMQSLLDEWGGIEVPGESELVTSENLYTNILETPPGDSPTFSRNSVFLTDLFSATLTKILSSKLDENTPFYNILSNSLDEKHVQFTFKNSTARAYMNDNGWDGNIDNNFYSTPVNIDWNWGTNKANLFTKKNHTLEIEIKDENTIDYTYQIAIENDSSKNEYPEGQYSNYVRIFLPYSATVTGIKGFLENKFDMYDEGGYKVVGGWFIIPIKETKTLEVKYRLTREDNSSSFLLVKNDTHYEIDLYIYKQPGSKKDSYNLSLSYPQQWDIESSDTLTRIENNVNRRFELSSDQHFFISWQR